MNSRGKQKFGEILVIVAVRENPHGSSPVGYFLSAAEIPDDGRWVITGERDISDVMEALGHTSAWDTLEVMNRSWKR